MNEFPIDGKQQEQSDRDEVEEPSVEPTIERDEGPAEEVLADEPAASVETESEPERTTVTPEEDEATSPPPHYEVPESPSTPDVDSDPPVTSDPGAVPPETTPVDSTASESPATEDATEAASPEGSMASEAPVEPEDEDEATPDAQAVEDQSETAAPDTATPEDSAAADPNREEHPAEGEHHGEGELHRPRIVLKAGTDRESIKALELCREKVSQLNLKMHPLAARWDGEKHVTIFFRADEKVDFRKLVRELSRVLRARIELRQLGPREQGKLCGLVGKCGQPLCCQTFLGEFTQSSIKMAKTQDLALNPMKISGVCGRLLCCLNYEQEMYAEVKSRMPKVNKWVETEFGTGRVTALNVLKETVTVQLETSTRELPLDQVRLAEAPSQS